MKIQKLIPACKSYIWGGTRLKEIYGKVSDNDTVSESWELSFLDDGPSKTEGGKPLKETVSSAELGENVTRFENFPVLVKFIDAKQNLSIQVHPSDEYALKNEHSYGKTEMWYIVEATPDAGIYLGFIKDVTVTEVERAIANNTIESLLNFFPVREGETYFIPSGTMHAILKGCLILEIQQSSNLTYRVYDYDRVDASGNKRPLHIDKALKVCNLQKYVYKPVKDNILGASKYFAARKAVVGDNFFTDGNSFELVTCVKGDGKIEDLVMKAGDSFFVPANYGKYSVSGDAQIVVVSVRKYYIGIDLGGTFIKGGIVDDSGNILISDKIPTQAEKGSFAVAENIAALCKKLLSDFNMTFADIEGIGIGVPGLLDGERGEVLYSNNLNWKHFLISDTVESLTGISVKIANDADVACLGEYKFGAGKGVSDCIMITLGTGVGSGVITGGKLYTGNGKAGVEIGHMVICNEGVQCNCGRKGCFEAYCSATALIWQTKHAMIAHPDSLMWQIGGVDKVTGRTAFDYCDIDQTAKSVVENYISYLTCGIVNIANVFRPQKIIIGGGVGEQKERLIKPLQSAVDQLSFGGELSPKCKIVAAMAGNKAGILGAAALWMEK